MKQDLNLNIQSLKRELEDKLWQNKTDSENLMKSTRQLVLEDQSKFKEEMLVKLEDTDIKIHREFSKLLDDTTQSIEDAINNNLIGQMRELDQALQDVITKVNSMD
mmetsp:Transcript_11277/g.8281  ORF Transcript_11277/g.8281 Transcript_11277/m.8281 type:complete len:106 (+) Transcript_11277:181-498(+)